MADLRQYKERIQNAEPTQEFSLIPADEYSAIITESEFKTTSTGTGQYLKLTFQIIEGEFNSRLLWVNLNLDNPNETAMQIAEKELSSICQALGISAPDTSEELHDIPLIIKVGIAPAKGGYEESNKIKSYKSLKHNVAPQAQQKQATVSKQPWKK